MSNWIIEVGGDAGWMRWSIPADSAKEAGAFAMEGARTAFAILTAAQGRARPLPGSVRVTSRKQVSMSVGNFSAGIKQPMLEAAGRIPGDSHPDAPWTPYQAIEAGCALARLLGLEHAVPEAESVEFRMGFDNVSQDPASMQIGLNAVKGDSYVVTSARRRLQIFAVRLAYSIARKTYVAMAMSEDIPTSATLRAALLAKSATDEAAIQSLLGQMATASHGGAR